MVAFKGSVHAAPMASTGTLERLRRALYETLDLVQSNDKALMLHWIRQGTEIAIKTEADYKTALKHTDNINATHVPTVPLADTPPDPGNLQHLVDVGPPGPGKLQQLPPPMCLTDIVRPSAPRIGLWPLDPGRKAIATKRASSGSGRTAAPAKKQAVAVTAPKVERDLKVEAHEHDRVDDGNGGAVGSDSDDIELRNSKEGLATIQQELRDLKESNDANAGLGLEDDEDEEGEEEEDGTDDA